MYLSILHICSLDDCFHFTTVFYVSTKVFHCQPSSTAKYRRALLIESSILSAVFVDLKLIFYKKLRYFTREGIILIKLRKNIFEINIWCYRPSEVRLISDFWNSVNFWAHLSILSFLHKTFLNFSSPSTAIINFLFLYL